MIGHSNYNFKNACAQIVQGLNSGEKKWSQKLEKYGSIIYDLELLKNNEIDCFDVITIRDILRSSDEKTHKKLSYINDLMSNYEFLLRDATIEGTRTSGEEENITKE